MCAKGERETPHCRYVGAKARVVGLVRDACLICRQVELFPSFSVIKSENLVRSCVKPVEERGGENRHEVRVTGRLLALA